MTKHILEERIVFIGASWTSIMPGAQATALACQEMTEGRPGRFLHASLKPERPLLSSELGVSITPIALGEDGAAPLDDFVDPFADEAGEEEILVYQAPEWSEDCFDGLPTLREAQAPFLAFLEDALIVGEWPHAILADLGETSDLGMLGRDRLVCIRNLARRFDPSSRFDSPADGVDASKTGEEWFVAYFEAMRERLLRLVAMAQESNESDGSGISAAGLRAMQFAGPQDVEFALDQMRASDTAERRDEADIEKTVHEIRARLLARLREGPLLLSEMSFALAQELGS